MHCKLEAMPFQDYSANKSSMGSMLQSRVLKCHTDNRNPLLEFSVFYAEYSMSYCAKTCSPILHTIGRKS